MNRWRAKSVCSTVFLLLLSASMPAEKLRNHFDSDAPFTAPAFFDFVVLGAAGEAQWKVIPDASAPSSPNQLTQSIASRPTESIAAALRRNSAFRDGAWSVAIKRGEGRAGVLFRMAGNGDFLVLLIHQANGDARLLSFQKGRSIELAKGHAELGGAWGSLTITANGSNVSAKWDGKPLLEASDPNPVAGKSGLATAGPGVASFDEFVLEPASAPESGKP